MVRTDLFQMVLGLINSISCDFSDSRSTNDPTLDLTTNRCFASHTVACLLVAARISTDNSRDHIVLVGDGNTMGFRAETERIDYREHSQNNVPICRNDYTLRMVTTALGCSTNLRIYQYSNSTERVEFWAICQP